MFSFGNKYKSIIQAHYKKAWGAEGHNVNFVGGPLNELPDDFCILEFSPRKDREMWTYATCCMSQPNDKNPIELHIFSPEKSGEPVELLAAAAHYHRCAKALGVGHSVNFGKPWISQSLCEYGFISLPYLDGPELEDLSQKNSPTIKFLWIIPITKEELKYKKEKGIEALESIFEEKGLSYINPHRSSLC